MKPYSFLWRLRESPKDYRYGGLRAALPGDGPFTKPVPASILELLEAQGV